MASDFTITAVACVVLATLTSSQNILITWSKRGGGFAFNFVTVTFMAEVTKFLISLFMTYREYRRQQLAKPTLPLDSTGAAGTDGAAGIADAADTRPPTTPINVAHELSLRGFTERLPFALPALIYFAKNNLVFLGLKNLDPVSFQLLGNMKILTTTLLFRAIMKRPLSDLKWISLLLLCVGLTYTQLKGDAELRVSFVGLSVMVAIATLSGLAGVATEYLMKANPARARESLHVQNLWLYFYGIVFNLLAIVIDDWDSIVSQGFFYGYSGITVIVLLNNSFSGLAVSAIMKYSNNLVKLFTFATSLLLTTVLSVALFHYSLTPQFVLGAAVVFVSLYLYNRKEGGGLR